MANLPVRPFESTSFASQTHMCHVTTVNYVITPVHNKCHVSSSLVVGNPVNP